MLCLHLISVIDGDTAKNVAREQRYYKRIRLLMHMFEDALIFY